MHTHAIPQVHAAAAALQWSYRRSRARARSPSSVVSSGPTQNFPHTSSTYQAHKFTATLISLMCTDQQELHVAHRIRQVMRPSVFAQQGNRSRVKAP